MTSVDDLTEFIVEGLADMGDYGLVIDAPGVYDGTRTDKLWLLGTKTGQGAEGFIYDEDLVKALNKMSQAWDFTYKDLHVHDPVDFSKVFHVAGMAARRDSAVQLWAPRRPETTWRVVIEATDRVLHGGTLADALMLAFDDLTDWENK
jgi:hypothetical protein